MGSREHAPPYNCVILPPSVISNQPAGRLVAASKAAVPTVSDQAAALQLGNYAKATAQALAELRNASSKVGFIFSFLLLLYLTITLFSFLYCLINLFFIAILACILTLLCLSFHRLLKCVAH